MSAEDELKDIKEILASIRDQNKIANSATQSALDYKQYASELKLARDELNLLEKGTGEYNRKLREVEKLSRLTKNALRDQRRESDMLSLSINGLSAAMDMLGNSIDLVVVKLGGLVTTVMKDVKELDNLTTQFQAATGASSAMASNIGGLTDRLRVFGVSNEEAAKAVGSVYSNFTLFSRLNEETQDQLIDTVALMGELGVSSDTSAKLLEMSFRTLGNSVEEANGLLIDMRGTARALEVPVEQLTSDFLAQESIVASLGEQGVDSFKKMAAASKSTGVSIEGLTGLYEKFHDFDAAAEAAAHLQTFGINLDFMAIQLEEDPVRRLEMLKQAFISGGMTAEKFTNLHIVTQRELVKGLTDVPTMLKLLQGDMSELEDAALASQYTFEEMKKDAFGLKGFDKVLNNMMNSFKRPIEEIQKAGRRTFEAFTPTIEMFQSYTDDMLEATEVFVKNNSQLVGGLAIAYNMFNLDVVQQGYSMFKGIMGFTGTILNNMFSFKGIMLSLAAGGLYMIRDQLGDIVDTFNEEGIIGGLKALGSAFMDLFSELKQKAVDAGFNEEFFVSLAKLALDGLTVAAKTIMIELIPVYDVIKAFLIKTFDDMEKDGTLDFIGEKVGYVFSKAISFIPGFGMFDPDTSLIGPDPGQSATNYLINKLGGFVGMESYEDPREADAKGQSFDEILAGLKAERKKGRDLAAELAEAKRELAKSQEAFDRTKGGQVINQKTAEVMEKAGKVMEVVEPRLADVSTALNNTVEALKTGIVEQLGKAVQALDQMNESQKRAHREYVEGDIIIEANGRELMSISKNAIDKAMKGY